MQIRKFGWLTCWLTRKSQPRSQPKHYENKKRQTETFVAFCRNEATRTPDPYVPNVVRYQLRYIPPLLMQKSKNRLNVKTNRAVSKSLLPIRNICNANINQKTDKRKFFKSFLSKHLHNPKTCPTFALANKTVP